MLYIPDKIRAYLRTRQKKAHLPPTYVKNLLADAGLRPTQQRILLGNLLFRNSHRHVTADDLRKDVRKAGVPMSLATIYNTLNQFVVAGILRKISISSERTFYDTNPQSHQHFYIEEEQRMIDIPSDIICLKKQLEPPEGYALRTVEVVIRLHRINNEKLS